MKTIGIVGTRRRNSIIDFDKCLRVVQEIYEEGDRFVSGGCPKGGDEFAYGIAKRLGATITIHFPNWNKQGMSAGKKKEQQDSK
jgi:hypothetical protein